MLSVIIVEDLSLNDKLKLYRLNSNITGAMVHCVNGLLDNDIEKANYFLTFIKNSLEMPIENVINKPIKEQITKLYSPFVTWLESLFNLELDEVKLQHKTWINKMLSQRLVDQCLKVIVQSTS